MSVTSSSGPNTGEQTARAARALAGLTCSAPPRGERPPTPSTPARDGGRWLGSYLSWYFGAVGEAPLERAMRRANKAGTA